MAASSRNYVFRCIDQAMAAPFRWVSWQQGTGEQFENVRPWLVASDKLAISATCVHTRSHHCRYRIVEHASGTFTGVCDEGRCERREFSREELIQYQPNFSRIRAGLARLLGLRQDRSPPTHPCLLPVGDLPLGRQSYRVSLTGGTDGGLLMRLLQTLWMESDRQRIIIYMSRLSQTPELSAFVRKVGWPEFVAEDHFVLERQDLQWDSDGEENWLALIRTIGGAGSEGFPGIDGLRWEDLVIRFIDGHTIAVRGGGFSGRFSYAEMGMEDKRTKAPDKQWVLLRRFAEGFGQLDWSSKGASERNKKRKERLAGILKDFFHIQHEPFVYDKASGGWGSLFKIEPE